MVYSIEEHYPIIHNISTCNIKLYCPRNYSKGKYKGAMMKQVTKVGIEQSVLLEKGFIGTLSTKIHLTM